METGRFLIPPTMQRIPEKQPLVPDALTEISAGWVGERNSDGETYRELSISDTGAIRCQSDGGPPVTQRTSPRSAITFSVRVIVAATESESGNANDPLRSMRERISSRDAGFPASISAMRQARLNTASSCFDWLGSWDRIGPIVCSRDALLSRFSEFSLG